ncbi:MAG: ABC transporter substrate-binding protein [Deltaproteobacteria bacterium]|nr:ABC transporter substrate-binding protein [Deltaproteobacteria bacterium]MBW2153977.1 ABC transporter substrate-binding protein [Deltaproteobacteria bacterium]
MKPGNDLKKAKHLVLVTVILGALMILTASASAKEVKIGIIWPLTGPNAYLGKTCKSMTDVFLDLVNNSHDIDSPGDIFRSKGLPNLGGAKVKFIYGDDEAKPDVGRAAAERLITVDKVHAMQATVMSGVTSTISQVTEKYQVPLVNSNSTSPKLTQRGYKWFFRTTPHAQTFIGTILAFLKDLREKQKDLKIETIAVVCEDTQWGQDAADVIRKNAPNYGFRIVLDIPYAHEATNVDAEVLKIKSTNPDVIFMSSYDNDAILFQKTYKKYGVNIPIVANNTGHTNQLFGDTFGNDTHYVMTRDMWSASMLETIPLAKTLDKMLKQIGFEAGMNETTGRTFIGMLALMDAVNRAGSTDNRAIQKALQETDIPGSYLALPWEGVKFDETGQNIYGSAIITQWHGSRLKAVWPWKISETNVVWKLPPW